VKRVAVLDYGRGNLRSVQKALEGVGLSAQVTRIPQEILDAQALVLPGVGAFRDCMVSLERLGLLDPLLRSLEAGKPFLGICLGLQILFDESEEFGPSPGLGFFSGRVRRFSADAPAMKELKIPHMGWNTVQCAPDSKLFRGIPPETYFYFVHSYYVEPEDPQIVLGRTEYGVPFPSVVQKDHVVAMQFHPEKSQRFGLKLLENFGAEI
jgi:glutamine amidotransferase